ncbi:MAG: Flp family type IVb pilin [Gemmatimonadetes bacterium]|nr:Flp family type IVb pilin [Gemmatimonadota bacterium]NIO31904.1 Flp family type IVb pilin [Gemmatimonadota bacterium]
MKRITDVFRRLWNEDEAEVAIEYGLLVALVALALVAVFNLFADEIGNFFQKITNRIANCPDGTCN